MSYRSSIVSRQGYNTGSLVFYAKAPPAAFIGGQWNHYRIRAVGSRFVVRLDDREVLDVSDSSHAAGVIGLQYNEDKPIEFRNIKLRPLGLAPLFNGHDLSGWQKVDPPEPRRCPRVGLSATAFCMSRRAPGSSKR